MKETVYLQLDGKTLSKCVIKAEDAMSNRKGELTEKEILRQQLELLSERSKSCEDDYLSQITNSMINLMHAIQNVN